MLKQELSTRGNWEGLCIEAHRAGNVEWPDTETAKMPIDCSTPGEKRVWPGGGCTRRTCRMCVGASRATVAREETDASMKRQASCTAQDTDANPGGCCHS